jgi:hypothetical protein
MLSSHYLSTVIMSASKQSWSDEIPDLHSYAFDCVTHHLFHPHGADSLRSTKDEEIAYEIRTLPTGTSVPRKQLTATRSPPGVLQPHAP